MNNFLNISPVIFATTGLILFITGLFMKSRYKIYFSITGLIFVGLFAYKLLIIQNESELTSVYTDRGNSDFHLSQLSAYYLTIGINIFGLILWLFAILKMTFEKSIPKQKQITTLLCGGVVIIVSLIIYKILGNLIGAICFPIMTIAYFLAFNSFYKRLKTE